MAKQKENEPVKKKTVKSKKKCGKRKCNEWVNEVMALKSKSNVSFKDALKNASANRKNVNKFIL